MSKVDETDVIEIEVNAYLYSYEISVNGLKLHREENVVQDFLENHINIKIKVVLYNILNFLLKKVYKKKKDKKQLYSGRLLTKPK